MCKSTQNKANRALALLWYQGSQSSNCGQKHFWDREEGRNSQGKWVRNENLTEAPRRCYVHKAPKKDLNNGFGS